MYTPTLLIENNGKASYISAGRDFDTVEDTLDKLKQYL